MLIKNWFFPLQVSRLIWVEMSATPLSKDFYGFEDRFSAINQKGTSILLAQVF